MNATTFRIYYMRPSFFRDGILSKAKTTDLAATHVYLKDVVLPGTDESRLDLVFTMMQGENWSPHGEARALIEQKGLAHTSMSVGDVIVVNGTPFVVATIGFERLSPDVLRNVPDERGALAGRRR